MKEKEINMFNNLALDKPIYTRPENIFFNLNKVLPSKEQYNFKYDNNLVFSTVIKEFEVPSINSIKTNIINEKHPEGEIETFYIIIC
jgi:hypothetical protein